ncbi:potassium channel family protein [Methanocalculus sp.]|uniref:potassium channel family protein n=1 Tax=Methanocalculus sp. TaxID=2004547 RepID=UPI00271D752E|nr:potassium channel family protein [Methanocalculus sp.]MDO8841998.1 potassium channel family protein [Methanocalculus sp.]
MHSGDTQFRLYLIVLLTVLMVGSVGLAVLEGLSFFDAFYFVIVTIATVGYGDIVPVTDAGRLLVMILILAGVGTFVTVAAYFIEMTVSRNDLHARRKKVRMIIWVFFSEVGVPFIDICKGGVSVLRSGIPDLLVTDEWKRRNFVQARKNLSSQDYAIDLSSVDLLSMQQFLLEKRSFIIQLLQHPMLSEHEPFSDMITAICHFEEELSARSSLVQLSAGDCAHLSRDCNRVISLLVLDWLDHMEYLKEHYPYLFSLSVRTNPFDPNASAEVV